MKSAKALIYVALLLFGLGVVQLPAAQAQAICPYAQIRVDAAQSLDEDAICNAAQPWSDAGWQVLIYLTDQTPANEDAWYSQLDQVEIATGLRDAGLDDSFERRGLSLAATTGTPATWGIAVTIGDRLYDTPLDTDGGANQVRTQIQAGLREDNPTQGFVQGLNTAYGLAESALAEPTPFPFLPVGGAAAAGGVALISGRTVLGRRRRYQQRQQQLETLKGHTANLLMACEQQISSASVDDMVPYRLFTIAGGSQYPQLDQQVRTWLGQARQALDQAFVVKDDLSGKSPHSTAELVEAIRAWELFYLTIVGGETRKITTSEEALHQLFTPTQLGYQSQDNQLMQQLQTIQQTLADKSLVVELTEVSPDAAEIDPQGIVGYLQQVVEQINRLEASQANAPRDLAAAQEQRDTVAATCPASLGLSPDQALAGVDRTLAESQALQDQGRYLDAIDQSQQARQQLTAISASFSAVVSAWMERNELTELQNRGFRLDSLASLGQQQQQVTGKIKQELAQGHYNPLPDLAADLQQCTKTLSQKSQDLVAQHSRNQQTLQDAQQMVARLDGQANTRAATIVSTLETYPPSNSQPAAAILTSCRQELDQCRDRMAEAERLNSMAVQDFEAAAQVLAAVDALFPQIDDRLNQVEQHLHWVRQMETRLDQYLGGTYKTLQFIPSIASGQGLLSSVAQVFKNFNQGGSNQIEAKVPAQLPPALATVEENIVQIQQLAAQREYLLALQHWVQVQQQSLHCALDQLANRCNIVRGSFPTVVRDPSANSRGQQLLQTVTATLQTTRTQLATEDDPAKLLALPDTLPPLLSQIQQAESEARQAAIAPQQTHTHHSHSSGSSWGGGSSFRSSGSSRSSSSSSRSSSSSSRSSSRGSSSRGSSSRGSSRRR